MRPTLLFATLTALAFISPLAFAELTLYKNFKCSAPSERREVHIYRDTSEVTAGPICRVDYLKAGETNALWTAQNSVEFCDVKAQELADRLEAANFKCVATATFEQSTNQ